MMAPSPPHALAEQGNDVLWVPAKGPDPIRKYLFFFRSVKREWNYSLRQTRTHGKTERSDCALRGELIAEVARFIQREAFSWK
jgi:hypothetical protein